MPFRAWEFVVGGSIGYFMARGARNSHGVVFSMLGLAGLILIAVSASYQLDGGRYPGWAALLPVLGTAFLIYVGYRKPDAISSRFLCWTPLVWIGLVSYGWYLWHWPLLIFARIADFGQDNPLRDLIMVTLALGLAIATYRFLELPIRNWRHSHQLGATGWPIAWAGVAACLGMFVAVGIVAGSAYILSKNHAALAVDKGLITSDISQCGGQGCADAGRGQLGFLTGDSHADMLNSAIGAQVKKLGAGIGSTFLSKCRWSNAFLTLTLEPCVASDLPIAQQAEIHGIDYFIVSRRWTHRVEEYDGKAPYLEELDAEFASLAENGRRLLVIGPLPEYPFMPRECILRAIRYGMDWDRCSRPRAQVESERKAVVEKLVRLSEENPNIVFFDPIELFCDEDTCRPFVGKTILYRDTNHLNAFGSEWFISQIQPEILWGLSGRLSAEADF